MCGRYTQTRDLEVLRRRFKCSTEQMELMPRYNLAPTQDAPVVIQDEDARVLKMMRWGLIPSWAKEEAIGNPILLAVHMSSRNHCQTEQFEETIQLRKGEADSIGLQGPRSKNVFLLYSASA